MGTFTLQANSAGVDPNLLRWLETAAANSQYNVLVQSGMRPGDKRFHGQGKAIDVRLQDPATGKTIPNYQSPENFAAYQGFANLARSAQMQLNPEMGNLFRWGGYFSGGKDKYGALDLMHFDVGGVPTAGGGWDTGLTPEQAAIWGLTAGTGGYAGPGTVATAFQESTLAPPDEPAWSKQLQEFGKSSARSGSGGQARQQAQALTQSPLTPAPAFDAAPAPTAPAPAPAAPEAAMTGLADLFKVGEIGSRIGQAAKLPGARRF